MKKLIIIGLSLLLLCAYSPKKLSAQAPNANQVYELMLSCSENMQRLFLDFLNYHFEDMVYKPKHDENYIMYPMYGSNADDGKSPLEQAYRVKFGEIDTYNELLKYFNQYCTEEYSIRLLHNESGDGVYYFDIGEKLYVFSTISCFLGFSDSRYDRYTYSHNKLTFYYKTAYEDYSSEGSEQIYNGPEYTITLENVDGNWLISECTEPDLHGYCWSGDKQLCK